MMASKIYNDTLKPAEAGLRNIPRQTTFAPQSPVNANRRRLRREIKKLQDHREIMESAELSSENSSTGTRKRQTVGVSMPINM